jgi:hypothetical protein
LIAAARSAVFFRIASASVRPNSCPAGALHAPNPRVAASAVALITMRIFVPSTCTETLIFFHAVPPVNAGTQDPR